MTLCTLKQYFTGGWHYYITDSYPKAEAFNNYFRLVFTSEDTSSMPHMEGAPFPDMPSISISIEEVYHQLSNLQSNKASGPENIPAYLKRIVPFIAPIIFQSSLNQGALPSDWKTANIIPIHKKGNRSQPSNYIQTGFFNLYLLQSISAYITLILATSFANPWNFMWRACNMGFKQGNLVILSRLL